MRLVYDDTGKEVQISDVVTTFRGEEVTVEFFRKPHKSNSEGKVTIKPKNFSYSREYYVGVIGATWVEREDRV